MINKQAAIFCPSIWFMALSIFLLSSMKAYGKENFQKIQYPKLFIDSYGNSVKLEKSPERIISLAPNITEILFYLGAGGKIAGVTDFCDFPAETSLKPKIGGIENPNIEKIVSLKPDLVIGISQGKVKPFVDKLKSLKINQFILSISTVEDILKSSKIIAALMGNPEQSLVRYEELKKKFEDFQNIKETPSKLRTLILLSYNPIFVATKNSFEGSLIAKLGGIAPDSIAGEGYIIMGKEMIMDFNPELIIIASHKKEKERFYSVLKGLKVKAVENNLVFKIDENLILRPGPRVFYGIEEIKNYFRKARAYH